MRSPRVSVVIPTYNRPQMVQEAVESVAAQTYDPIEVIVVDDASPNPVSVDMDGEVAIEIIRHEDNRGANAARNTGIQRATGDVIAFLDDDDRWDPEKIATQVDAFTTDPTHPGVVIVGQRYVNDEGGITGIKRPDLEGTVTAQLFSGGTAGGFSSIAVRAELLEEAGLPDEAFPSLQDREWLIRLSKYCTFRSIPEPLVMRRMGSHDQIADRFVEKRDRTYHMMLAAHSDTARDLGLEGPFRASLARSVAASALEAGAYADARRFALKALWHQPTDTFPAIVLLISLGGSITYRPAKRLKHILGRLVHG